MTMRERFAAVTTELLAAEPRLALVLADISSDMFRRAAARHPTRVINVGIREQLMIGITGGLALTGLRPIAHSYASFLVDRAFEQIKLDLDHQGAGAILVSTGGSYDAPSYGRTHFSPGDVELLDTLEDWTVHVPGHEDEVESLLRAAVREEARTYIRLHARSNARPHANFETMRQGARATVFAVGPTLDRVLEAVEDLDVGVVYLNTPRPLYPDRVLAAAGDRDVVVVESYLKGTSTRPFVDVLGDGRRILALGVGRRDLHRYGTAEDHDRWHGLDPEGLRRSIRTFLDEPRPRRGTGLRLEIFPRDLDATVDFYTSVLGFSIERDDRAARAPYVAFVRGAVRIAAAEGDARVDPAVRRPPSGVELVLEVDHIEDEYAHVKDSGWPLDAELTTRPWGLRDFRVLDPDGHYIRVTHRPS